MSFIVHGLSTGERDDHPQGKAADRDQYVGARYPIGLHLRTVCLSDGEAGDHQFDVWAEELDDGRQFGAAVARATRYLFRTDDAAAHSFEAGDLPFKILIERADAGVTDTGHDV